MKLEEEEPSGIPESEIPIRLTVTLERSSESTTCVIARQYAEEEVAERIYHAFQSVVPLLPSLRVRKDGNVVETSFEDSLKKVIDSLLGELIPLSSLGILTIADILISAGNAKIMEHHLKDGIRGRA